MQGAQTYRAGVMGVYRRDDVCTGEGVCLVVGGVFARGGAVDGRQSRGGGCGGKQEKKGIEREGEEGVRNQKRTTVFRVENAQSRIEKKNKVCRATQKEKRHMQQRRQRREMTE